MWHDGTGVSLCGRPEARGGPDPRRGRGAHDGAQDAHNPREQGEQRGQGTGGRRAQKSGEGSGKLGGMRVTQLERGRYDHIQGLRREGQIVWQAIEAASCSARRN